MRKNRVWLWILVAALVPLLGCGGIVVLGYLASSVTTGLGGIAGSWGDAVAVIEVKGVITSGQGNGVLGTTGVAYADRVITDLRAAIDDPSVKAIVIDVDSPGGSVVASAEIYKAFGNCRKPLVTAMGEMAASGGYYIACATHKIYVHPATLTGSIGVRWEFINAEELIKDLGIEVQIIKGGKHKDQGGWHRPLTEEEVGIYQAIVDEAYADFIQVVSLGRSLPIEQVRTLADGRVYTGRQAISLGLADAEGDLEDAIVAAGELGGIVGRPRVVRYERPPNLLGALTSMAVRARRPDELAILEELLGAGEMPRLQYLCPSP